MHGYGLYDDAADDDGNAAKWIRKILQIDLKIKNSFKWGKKEKPTITNCSEKFKWDGKHKMEKIFKMLNSDT